MSDPVPSLHQVIVQGEYSPDDYRGLLKQLFREFGNPRRSDRWQWEYVWAASGGGIYASGIRLQFSDSRDAMIAALKYKGTL